MTDFNPKKINYIQLYYEYMLIKNLDENSIIDDDDQLLHFQYPNGVFRITKADLIKKAQAQAKRKANKIKKDNGTK